MPDARVPHLSARSADRLDAVLSDAVADAEAGHPPDAALAKAAHAHGLPGGHVPLAVRAYNNGRAAAQLAASADPWEKAAAYPQASVAGVLERLAALVPPAAAPATDADYLTPPAAAQKSAAAPDLAALAAAFGVPDAPREKSAAAPAATTWGRVAPRRVSGELLGGLAEVFAKLAACVHDLTPEQYEGVRAAGAALHPAATRFAFDRLDRRRAKTARVVRPDAAVGRDHPAVRLLGALQHLHGRAPRPKAAAAAPGPADESEGGGRGKDQGGGFGRSVLAGFRRTASRFPTLVANRDETPKPSISGPLQRLRANVTGLQTKRQELELQAAHQALERQLLPEKEDPVLARQLERLDDQEALNGLLADPRLKTADPRTVVQTYRQLAGLAPTVMRNPAVAGDFVHRTVQTGPLSNFDLLQLAQLEKNVVQAADARRGGDDDA